MNQLKNNIFSKALADSGMPASSLARRTQVPASKISAAAKAYIPAFTRAESGRIQEALPDLPDLSKERLLGARGGSPVSVTLRPAAAAFLTNHTPPGMMRSYAVRQALAYALTDGDFPEWFHSFIGLVAALRSGPGARRQEGYILQPEMQDALSEMAERTGYSRTAVVEAALLYAFGARDEDQITAVYAAQANPPDREQISFLVDRESAERFREICAAAGMSAPSALRELCRRAACGEIALSGMDAPVVSKDLFEEKK